ncbi:response regulator transcription factor [Schaedlerella arabinosiphila]|uniref:Stage 0 sporulation protein A homolog n=1 Tax=Schaedlerella arabinosiphila TaxID=2044587 RepID=A0A9X5CFB4_9FIRM|nr:response regulator transcription factor [Schaedlerella arabinosiphila]KAI4440908.1 Transcriptional regulatory protein CseB [Schaedlerella arabinosiphila]MCI9604765.1 response regulator transcription factor [Ruminococcus sp.]NDO72132.1 response regulator transcription factor [Schaedlerella arabinosiphila]
MAKILLLEDDTSLNRGISLKLEKEGYEVLSASGVSRAEEIFRENEVALIISDITMEDGDGLEFCRNIRRTSDVHLIFLTALDQEVDIVNGYDAGADDYITKPFSLMVLISKVNALMRRIGQDQEEHGQILVSGSIRVQCREMRVYKEETEILLSKKEMQLLLHFLEYPKQIISKEQILEAVWDMDGQFVDDNTVPVTISRLKKKIAGEEDYEYIKNVRGLGYLWTAEVSKK